MASRFNGLLHLSTGEGIEGLQHGLRTLTVTRARAKGVCMFIEEVKNSESERMLNCVCMCCVWKSFDESSEREGVEIDVGIEDQERQLDLKTCANTQCHQSGK